MKEKAIPVKERIKKCPHCDYEWLARTPNPPKCPFCQKTIVSPEVPKA